MYKNPGIPLQKDADSVASCDPCFKTTDAPIDYASIYDNSTTVQKDYNIQPVENINFPINEFKKKYNHHQTINSSSSEDDDQNSSFYCSRKSPPSSSSNNLHKRKNSFLIEYDDEKNNEAMLSNSEDNLPKKNNTGKMQVSALCEDVLINEVNTDKSIIADNKNDIGHNCDNQMRSILNIKSLDDDNDENNDDEEIMKKTVNDDDVIENNDLAGDGEDDDDEIETDTSGADDDDIDEEFDTNSNFSNLSGISDISGQEWKPITAKPLNWVQRQIHSGANPRDLLSQILVNGTKISSNITDMSLWRLLASMLSEPPRRQKLRNINTIDDTIKLLETSKNIIVLTGAGVSVSCGIPDFRSTDGIYSRLAKDFPDLPDPQAMFDINYFSRDPRPFYKFAREIYPGQFKPSPCHRFIKLLEQKGKLLRNYTQNIDTLEQVAGIKNVIECHGSFATASCTKCHYKTTSDMIRDDIFAQRIPKCPKCKQQQQNQQTANNSNMLNNISSCSTNISCTNSIDDRTSDTHYQLLYGSVPPGSSSSYRELVQNGIMKPDIVFFGEGLPDAFHTAMGNDKDKCDLLIVIGSSLKVRPVALIPSSIPANVPQILINRERLSHLEFDVELLGDSDTIINQLCHMLSGDWSDVCWSKDFLDEAKHLKPKTERSTSTMTASASSPTSSPASSTTHHIESCNDLDIDTKISTDEQPILLLDTNLDNDSQSTKSAITSNSSIFSSNLTTILSSSSSGFCDSGIDSSSSSNNIADNKPQNDNITGKLYAELKETTTSNQQQHHNHHHHNHHHHHRYRHHHHHHQAKSMPKRLSSTTSSSSSSTSSSKTAHDSDLISMFEIENNNFNSNNSTTTISPTPPPSISTAESSNNSTVVCNSIIDSENDKSKLISIKDDDDDDDQGQGQIELIDNVNGDITNDDNDDDVDCIRKNTKITDDSRHTTTSSNTRHHHNNIHRTKLNKRYNVWNNDDKLSINSISERLYSNTYYNNGNSSIYIFPGAEVFGNFETDQENDFSINYGVDNNTASCGDIQISRTNIDEECSMIVNNNADDDDDVINHIDQNNINKNDERNIIKDVATTTTTTNNENVEILDNRERPNMDDDDKSSILLSDSIENIDNNCQRSQCLNEKNENDCSPPKKRRRS